MERHVIERAARLAGASIPPGADFEVTGPGPLLRTPHAFAEGASVARLLTGLAASELWRTRTGRPQHVAVDPRHAVANLNALRYVRLVGGEPLCLPDPRQPLMARLARIIATGDGRYIQLHPSFSDGPQVLELLGLGETASTAEIDAAVRRRDAFELEAALVRHKLCGGVVRSREEWDRHPQGRAVAPLPTVMIDRIGDAPPQALPGGDRPASGIRVLDLTRILAGPTCAKTIAEHGADVLHVGSPRVPDAPTSFETNIGKRHCSVDLTEPEGRATLEALAREADVFSQGYRAGSLEARGLGPARLAELRPGIVYVSESCYGPVGPWAARPGWEQLAQAATGIAQREGEVVGGGVPCLAPLPVNDYCTGFLAAYGAMTALARRAVEGGSWHVQVSLCQTAMWYQRLGDDLPVAPEAEADVGRALDVSEFLDEMDAPGYGRIEYLTPAVRMSETPARWDLPPAPLGAHEPRWLARP